MTDDGREPIDVTGRWVGFSYGWEKPGRYPIVADLHQTGNMITGEICDQIMERSGCFDKCPEILGKQIPNEVRRSFERVFRRRGTVTISRLPDTSQIQGTIRGSQVRLTKSYWGVDSARIAGAKQIESLLRKAHQVQYSGDFDRDRMRIVGRWGITQWGSPGWSSPPQSWGSFELYRKP